ncbi:hypothetical protein [Ruminococcus sp. Marseille-P6503]|uniref:hypothetical protein n=1 Tax=Ruminococcus sp. Marseille-P6503 TaxID=2364796 RepID=UPI000F53EE0F|nr:hypothetical protein [Ruminococcus sp. Marseille-P6503]
MRKAGVKNILLFALILVNILLFFVCMRFYIKNYNEDKPRIPTEYELVSFYNYVIRSRYMDYSSAWYNKDDNLLEIEFSNEEAMEIIKEEIKKQGFDEKYFKLEVVQWGSTP